MCIVQCALYVEQWIIHVQQVLYSVECIENGAQCTVHAVAFGELVQSTECIRQGVQSKSQITHIA